MMCPCADRNPNSPHIGVGAGVGGVDGYGLTVGSSDGAEVGAGVGFAEVGTGVGMGDGRDDGGIVVGTGDGRGAGAAGCREEG